MCLTFNTDDKENVSISSKSEIKSEYAKDCQLSIEIVRSCYYISICIEYHLVNKCFC